MITDWLAKFCNTKKWQRKFHFYVDGNKISLFTNTQ